MLKRNLVRLANSPAPIRLGTFVLTLLLFWIPVATPIYLWVSDRNLVSILTMALLYIQFLLLVRFWGQKVYKQPQLLRSYGLQGSRRNGLELLSGLGLGLLFTLSLFALEGQLSWLVWRQASAELLPRIILEGFLVALAVGFVEELLFRGWLLDELERDYHPTVSLWTNALVYAVLHFIKPLTEIIRTWPQFPGLLLLGLALVWAKRGSQGRLGLPMGLHAGLVWGYYIINVGQLMQYSGQVPDWITGVDRNPLAGLIGLTFLSILAFWMKKRI